MTAGRGPGATQAVPTHYDTLGVPTGASSDEIRRAYRALARRLHPDRHLHSEPAEAARADRRMREVNAAWTVLSDSGLKERYDLELALARAQAARAASQASRAVPTARPRAAATTTRPVFGHVDVAPGDGLWTALFRVMPWVLVIFVLGGIFVFTAFAAGRTDDGTGGSDQQFTLPTASVGDCVRFPAGTSMDLVDCSIPNEGRIVEKVPGGRPCPPGTSSRYLPEEGLYACIRL